MKKKFRIFLSWTLVSLLLQIPTYYFLNKQVEKVMTPPETPVIVRTLKTNIPGTAFENMQISYQKDYLAYKENGVLKVYNLKQEKEVFSKPAPGNDKNLGVLYFQWLPDRNTLIYFYARKNPNPVTTEVVPATPSSSASANSGTSSGKTSTSSSTSNKSTVGQSSKDTKAHTQSVSSTQSTDSTSMKTEDPNQAPAATQAPAQTTPAQQQRVVTRYNNPQITDLYTLELPSSDDTTAPDDRFNESISSFPAGGQITNMVVSTFTNLLYLTIKNGTNIQLMEIDVMKNVRTLNRTGEVITDMAASDKFGTLYLESKTGKSKTIQALDGSTRQTVSDDETETILGDRSGTLYLGQIEGDNLVGIRSAADSSDSSKLEFKTLWQGAIPFKDAKVTIGVKNQIVILSKQTAYIIETDGQQKEVDLSGKENFVSQDGAELVELTPGTTSTDVELKPLQEK